MSAASRLVVWSGASAGAELALGPQPAVVGRGLGNDLVVDDPRVSRRHLRIMARPGGAVVEDLGSTNGSYVNGARLRGPRRLGPGDELRVGRTVLLLDPVARPPRPVGPAAPDCRRVRALLERHLDGELGDAEREAVSGHLRACRDCLSRERAARAWRTVVVAALHDEAPEGLAERIAASIGRDAGS